MNSCIKTRVPAKGEVYDSVKALVVSVWLRYLSASLPWLQSPKDDGGFGCAVSPGRRSGLHRYRDVHIEPYGDEYYSDHLTSTCELLTVRIKT